MPLEALMQNDIYSLPKVLGVLALLSYLGIVLREKRRIHFDVPFSIFSLLLLWSAISAIWSVDPNLTLAKLTTLFQLLILYFLLINQVRDYKNIDRLMKFLFIGGVIFASFGLSDLLLIFTHDESRRLASIARNANTYFVIAICLIPACYWIFITQKQQKYKASAVSVLLILFVTSLYTQSRGGLISLGVFFFTYLLLTKNKFSWIALIAIFSFLFFQFLPAGYLERFESLTTSVRVTELWPSGLRAFENNLLLGSGLGTTRIVVPMYFGYATFLGQDVSVHNSPLAVGIELGIPGLLLYLLFTCIPLVNLYYAIRKSRKASEHLTQLSKIFLCVIVAYLASWLKSGSMEYMKMLWVLLGIATCLVYQLKTSSKDVGRITR